MQSNERIERMEIGRRLREARERAHISAADASERLGVQPLAVDRWERGAAMPSLIDFKGVLQLYGVMACDILFDVNPYELAPSHVAELTRHAKNFTPSLQARMDTFMAMFAKGKEPEFRKAA